MNFGLKENSSIRLVSSKTAPTFSSWHSVPAVTSIPVPLMHGKNKVQNINSGVRYGSLDAQGASMNVPVPHGRSVTVKPYADNPSDMKKSLNRKKAWGSQSYADLIARAIESSPDRRLTLSQIYDWMIKNVPYFNENSANTTSSGWKNSVRHNLSLHRRFTRVQNDSSGKSSWWVINDADKSYRNYRRESHLSDGPNGRKKMKKRYMMDSEMTQYSSTHEGAGYTDYMWYGGGDGIGSQVSECDVAVSNIPNINSSIGSPVHSIYHHTNDHFTCMSKVSNESFNTGSHGAWPSNQTPKTPIPLPPASVLLSPTTKLPNVQLNGNSLGQGEMLPEIQTFSSMDKSVGYAHSVAADPEILNQQQRNGFGNMPSENLIGNGFSYGEMMAAGDGNLMQNKDVICQRFVSGNASKPETLKCIRVRKVPEHYSKLYRSTSYSVSSAHEFSESLPKTDVSASNSLMLTDNSQCFVNHDQSAAEYTQYNAYTLPAYHEQSQGLYLTQGVSSYPHEKEITVMSDQSENATTNSDSVNNFCYGDPENIGANVECDGRGFTCDPSADKFDQGTYGSAGNLDSSVQSMNHSVAAYKVVE